MDESVDKLYVCGKAGLGIVGLPGAVLEPIRQMQASATEKDLIPQLAEALKAHYGRNFGLRPFVVKEQVVDLRPQATIIYADRRPGAAGLCVMPSELNFSPIFMPQRYVMAGISNYALYLFQRLWRDTFSVNDALGLGAFLITETSKLDPKVGPVPDLMVLGADGAQALDRSRIDEIIKVNDQRMAKFASSFQEPTNASP